MFTLVVLSALVAVSVAAPSGVISPLIYSNPSLTYVQAPSYALLGSVPTSISQQSSTVFHNAGPISTVELKPIPVESPISTVEVKATAVETPEPEAIAESDAEVIETVPENKDTSTAEIETPVVEAIPSKTIISHSNHVIHGAKAIVAAPFIQYAGTPVLQYAAAPAPLVRYVPSAYSIVAPASTYSTHGVVNSAGYISAAPIVHNW